MPNQQVINDGIITRNLYGLDNPELHARLSCHPDHEWNVALTIQNPGSDDIVLELPHKLLADGLTNHVDDIMSDYHIHVFPQPNWEREMVVVIYFDHPSGKKAFPIKRQIIGDFLHEAYGFGA